MAATLIAADLVLCAVDRESIVTLFEGPVGAIDQVAKTDTRVGAHLRDVWPDPLLQSAVSKMLVGVVSPSSSFSDTVVCSFADAACAGSWKSRSNYQIISSLTRTD